MTELAIAAAVVGAIGTMKQGSAQKAMYDAQAAQTMVQARSNVIKSRAEALKYKQEGVRTLDKIRKTIATVGARGAAGSIDPFSGSTGKLQVNIFDRGFLDFSVNKDNTNLARENMTIIQKSAEYQAGIYRAAGKQAKQSAMFKAVTSLAMAGATYGMGFGADATAATAATPAAAPAGFGGVLSNGNVMWGTTGGGFGSTVGTYI